MKTRKTLRIGFPALLLALGVVACDEPTPLESRDVSRPSFGEADGEGGGAGTGTALDPSGYGQTVASTGTILLSQFCDVKLVPPGFPAEPGHTYVHVEQGKTVQLSPGTYECTPVVDATGTLIQGQGMYVQVPQITLDLNGATIRSTAKAIDLHPDVGNGGVIVEANNVTVTNSSATRALIENFTQGIDVAGPSYVKISGKRLADGSYNLVSGRSGDGVALSTDRVDQLLIENVRLADVGGTMGAGVGAFLRRSSNVFIRGSEVGGWTAGIDVLRSQGLVFESNEICGGGVDIGSDDPASYTSVGNTFCTKAWF